jgi:hypothetical protein
VNRAICPYSLFFGHTNEGWLPLSVFDYRDCILVITKEPVPVIGVDVCAGRRIVDGLVTQTKYSWYV